MKYLKILGLAAVAAMALMAFGAGTASATCLHSTSSTTCLPAGTEIEATLAAGTSSKLTTLEGTTLNTCTSSSVTGKTSNAGSATETVTGSSHPVWSNCISGAVNTLEDGTLEIHYIAGTTNGTLTASGFKITVNTILGPCVYTAGSGTHLGVLTGAASGDATMDINATVKRIVGDTDTGTCPESGKWVATYTVTKPTPLYVEEK